MLKRILLITFLCAAARGAAATDYTDIWYNAVEPGYGFNIVQSDTFMFMTFFVYGSNNSPTWFTAQVNQDNTGNFNGSTPPYLIQALEITIRVWDVKTSLARQVTIIQNM